jgi:hypothetical protein
LSYRIIGLGFPFFSIISGAFGQMKHGELIGVGIQRNVGIDHMVSVCYLSTFSFAKRLARAKAAALGFLWFLCYLICYLGVNF